MWRALGQSKTLRDLVPSIIIDWSKVQDKYVAAAMYSNGKIYFFVEVPKLTLEGWESVKEICPNPYKYTVTSVRWEDSLTLRPKVGMEE